MIMKNLLLTGFEPFDGFTVNPSGEIAKKLNDNKIRDFNIIGVVLPLDYANALSILDTALEKHKPSVILCCGQANRATITIERLAVNAISTDRPDNYGNIPETDVIDADGPTAYFANIPPLPLVKAIREQGIPAYVSYHAGAYGCNWLLYNVMPRIEKGVIDAKATFVHLPPLPSQALQKDLQTLATMPLEMQVKALETIVRCL
jgi:pyroglutamyl-peptidase